MHLDRKHQQILVFNFRLTRLSVYIWFYLNVRKNTQAVSQDGVFQLRKSCAERSNVATALSKYCTVVIPEEPRFRSRFDMQHVENVTWLTDGAVNMLLDAEQVFMIYFK